MDGASIIQFAMNVRSFIDQWPTRADLADEIGVKFETVHKWAQRGAIPAEYHLDVLAAATQRGFTSDPLALAKMHARVAARSAEQ
jgi:hypothetical protein